MTKKKPWLLIYVIISFCVIVTAVIVSLTAGLNLGSDIAGGTQIEVLVSDSEKSKNELVSDTKNALRANGVSYETILLEDKYTDTYLVIRTNNKTFDHDKLTNSLSEKLGVEKEAVEGIYEISGSVTKGSIIWLSVTVILLILGIFFAGWIRYKLVTATSLTIAVLHSLILSTSLLILTRLPITITSFIVLASISILVLFAFVLTFERVNENKKLVHNSDLSSQEIVAISKKQTVKPLIFLTSNILLIALVLLFTQSLSSVFVALTIVVCLLSGVYSYWFVGISLYDYMLSIKEVADKRRLSKNNSPAPKKK